MEKYLTGKASGQWKIYGLFRIGRFKSKISRAAEKRPASR